MTGAVGLRAFARAKVNLCLHVTGRRADGLHQIESLVTFLDLADELSVKPSDSLQLELDATSPFRAEIDGGESNLVLRAARALRAACPGAAGARIRLDKRIPVAAGLGGGSADAAAVLQILRRLWEVPVSDQELARIGWEMGADIPVCLEGRAAVVGGGGEKLHPAPLLPQFWMVLVHPGGRLATRDVFAAYAAGSRADGSGLPALPAAFRDVAELVAWLKTTRNDLAPVAEELQPVCREVRRALESVGAMHVAMSGSGATHYGVFSSAVAAACALASLNFGWWCDLCRVG